MSAQTSVGKDDIQKGVALINNVGYHNGMKEALFFATDAKPKEGATMDFNLGFQEACRKIRWQIKNELEQI